MVHTPRVFTVPASAPFLPTLIKALLEGRLVPGLGRSDDPLALANATLYLPTRRACRLARDMFLAVSGSAAAILPRLLAIGDVEEDEIAFAAAADGDAADAADLPETLELPQALGSLERRLLLGRLTKETPQGPSGRPLGPEASRMIGQASLPDWTSHTEAVRWAAVTVT